MFEASQHESLASNQLAIEELHGRMVAPETSILDLAERDLREIGDGAYGKGRQLGAGAQGAVHQWDSPDGSRLAVKSAKPGFEKELEHERSMMASLGQHENVAGFVGDFVDEDEQLNVATEFLGGGDMEAMNRRLKQAMDDGEIGYGDYVGAMQYLHKGVLQGVAHLEENEVAHGDLKPDNVALDDDMVPKIIDFGTARHFGEKNAGVGNIAYALSPESIGSGAHASRGRDVFAVGQMVREGTEGTISDRGGSMQMNRIRRKGVQGSSIEVREDGPERVIRDIIEDDEVVGTEDLGRKDGSFAVHTALTDFLEGTTSNRVEDRFTAQRALDSQFLQDPLLQDEQAQELLKRLSGRGPETQAEDIELAMLGEDDEAHGHKSAMHYELLKRTKARRKALDNDASKRSKRVKKDIKAIDRRRARL